MKKYVFLAVSAISMTALTGCFHGWERHGHERPGHEKNEARRDAYGAKALPPQAHEGEGRPQCHKAKREECKRKCRKDSFGTPENARCSERCHEQCEKHKGDCKKNTRNDRENAVGSPKNTPYYNGFCPPGEATRGRC